MNLIEMSTINMPGGYFTLLTNGIAANLIPAFHIYFLRVQNIRDKNPGNYSNRHAGI